MDNGTKRSLIFLATTYAICLTLGALIGICLTPTKTTTVWMPQVEYIEQPKAAEDVLLEAGPEVFEHSLGEFKLTAYCPCEKCNGKWVGELTASGTELTVGRTIAVDPDVIPLGSIVDINGFEYVAEDTGSAIKGNRIDILFPSHKEALDFGVQYASVSIIYNNIQEEL
jgi:3D (Asp-Asp-Asp) domain-containing protein